MKREGEKEQESGKRREPQTPVQPPSSANPKKKADAGPRLLAAMGRRQRHAQCSVSLGQQGLQGGVSMGFSGRDPGPRRFPLHMMGLRAGEGPMAATPKGAFLVPMHMG